MKTHMILYIRDQSKSSAFYRSVLDQDPVLDVEGMTEFALSDGAVLGLMPETGIKRLLGEAFTDPALGHGIPRSELYLLVDEPHLYYERALAGGAKALSPLELRNWGDYVAYCADPDGHVLAFAKKASS